MTARKYAFITPSYRNDFEIAKDLCESMDRFVTFDFEHLLVVPSADVAQFSVLAQKGKRMILEREKILHPLGIYRLPLPTQIHLPFGVRKNFREQYFSFKAGRLSGWLVQQIIKLNAAGICQADTFIFADSDVCLVRPLAAEVLWTDGRCNLQQHVQGRDLGTHKQWRQNAHSMLGIGGSEREPFNYIGQLIPWHRTVLDSLLRRLEEIGRKKWYDVICEKKDVSEYILYGEYVIEVLNGAEHEVKDMRLYNSVWAPDAIVKAESIISRMEPENVAIHIQSTNPLAVEERRSIMNTVRVQLADGDDFSSGGHHA